MPATPGGDNGAADAGVDRYGPVEAMPQDLTRNYHLWREADARGDDEESDAAFGEVFKSCVFEPLPSAAFTARTMAAIAVVSAADARRAVLIRRALVWSGVPAVCLAAYFAAGPLLSILSDAFVALLNLLVRFVVWLANGASLRSGAWSVLTAIGRAAAEKAKTNETNRTWK